MGARLVVANFRGYTVLDPRVLMEKEVTLVGSRLEQAPPEQRAGAYAEVVRGLKTGGRAGRAHRAGG